MEKIDDNQLMKQVQTGQVNQLGVLYERHKSDLFKYFYRFTMDGGKSEDLVQNVFIRVLKYKHQFTGQGRFAYWLYTIAKNVRMDHYRKNDPIRHSEEIMNAYDHEADGERPDERLEVKQRNSIIHHALDQLSEDKKEAIILSRFHGFKYQEIAAMNEVSESAIKSRVQRGLLELKDIIQQMQIS